MYRFRKTFTRMFPALFAASLYAMVLGAGERQPIQTLNTQLAQVMNPSYRMFRAPQEADPAEVSRNVIDSIVNISSTRIYVRNLNDPVMEQFFGPGWDEKFPREFRDQSLGSGIVISPDGLILTNSHVVEESSELKVTFYDHTEYEAEIVGTDSATEIAVIRLKGENITGLHPIPFGNSDSLRVADPVLAIGNPLGLGHSVTMGIVSAKGRTELCLTEYDDFIQTDADINPGNSGGALVNLRGELVGINTAIARQSGGNQGIGFAIPSNLAREIMNILIEEGRVVRGWIGLNIQAITDDMALLPEFGSTEGVLVSDVLDDGPAMDAGIQVADVILGVNGTALLSTTQFRTMIAMLHPDTVVSLSVRRDGNPLTITARLGTRAETAPASNISLVSSAGAMNVSIVTNKARAQYNIPSGIKGVIIDQLDASNPAAKAGLLRGDVIRSVNRRQILNMADFNKLYTETQGSLLLYVFRLEVSFFVVVKK